MEILKIAIAPIGTDGTNDELIRSICETPAMLELCTPAVYENEEAALQDLDQGKVDALVLMPASRRAKSLVDSVEIIIANKTTIMPIEAEPTADDVIRLRDILKRDFCLSSPRIAIVQEPITLSPDFASQVSTEHGINTYGPYTTEQLMGENTASHFDGIITVGGEAMVQQIVTGLTQEAPIRFFVGMKSVVTAICQPVCENESDEEGLDDVSAYTHPFYTAIDIVRNRAFYDEARQNPLPKLFRDKRDDRKRDEATQTKAEQ